MKSIFKTFLFTTTSLLLMSCQKDTKELMILCPTGGPAIAFYNYALNQNFETTSNPQNGLIPMFQNNTYDIIVAPTQGGLKQIIKQNANYQIAATITFGNFYLVSFKEDKTEEMKADDKVLIFQNNDVPGKVFNYTYGDVGLSVTSVDNVSITKSVIENGGILTDETTIKFDYVYTAQPVVFATKSQIFKNVQDDFMLKSGVQLTQASIFVNKSSNKNLVNQFLTKIKADIENAISNPTLILDGITNAGSTSAQQGKFGTTAAAARAITQNGNGFSLGYKQAKDNKVALQAFVDLFPQLEFGELNEEIFYK